MEKVKTVMEELTYFLNNYILYVKYKQIRDIFQGTMENRELVQYTTIINKKRVILDNLKFIKKLDNGLYDLNYKNIRGFLDEMEYTIFNKKSKIIIKIIDDINRNYSSRLAILENTYKKISQNKVISWKHIFGKFSISELIPVESLNEDYYNKLEQMYKEEIKK